VRTDRGRSPIPGAYFRVTGERTRTRRVTDPERFDAQLSFGVAIVAGIVVTRYRSGRVAKVLTTAEGETLNVFEAWSGVSHRGQHDCAKELDPLGSPLFALRSAPGGRIQGRYEAPSDWPRAAAQRNEAALRSARAGSEYFTGTSVACLDEQGGERS